MLASETCRLVLSKAKITTVDKFQGQQNDFIIATCPHKDLHPKLEILCGLVLQYDGMFWQTSIDP